MSAGADAGATAAATATVLRDRAAAAPLWLPATGASMGRRYGPDVRLLVEPRRRRPRPGEVWAFVDAGGRIVVHRCLRRHRDGTVRFRGDAAPASDPDVPDACLVGPVTLVDDGRRRWRPRAWHAVRPGAAALARRTARSWRRARSTLRRVKQRGARRRPPDRANRA